MPSKVSIFPTQNEPLLGRDSDEMVFGQFVQNFFVLQTDCCTSCLGGRSKAIMQVKKTGLVTCGLVTSRLLSHLILASS